MQALVDFRGYRLVAMPHLPISGSPAYGSSDAFKSVYATDVTFNGLMQQLGAQLHVRGLNVSTAVPNGPKVHLAAGAQTLQLSTAADVGRCG